MLKRHFTWLKKYFTGIVYFLIVIFTIGILILLYYKEPNIIENKLLDLLNVLINSISISVGFFGAIFTLIFSLKDNLIIDKIMNSKKIRKQFIYMNYGIVASGFIIIVLILVIFVFESVEIQSNTSTISNSNLVYFILSFSFYFYCMFATYLYTISNIIFEKRNRPMQTKKNPQIKRRNH